MDREPLGAQVWVRPDDSAKRVRMLFERARESGLGWARLFLVWPWIEPEPGEWEFDVYDRAFDAAENFDIRIKATLTANSGPWHVGTPSMLHSHTGILDETEWSDVRRYVHRCARQYAEHPALGQWVLWNEPSGRPGAGAVRTRRQLEHWREWLSDRYPNITTLNGRWRTGFSGFDEIPFPEDIPHEVHSGGTWQSWRPWLDDWQSRAAWVNRQIDLIREILSEVDGETETCVNPGGLFGNQAAAGRDIDGMGDLVDTLGGSFHPPWHFTFARRWQFPSLVAAGVRRVAAGSDPVEVTEVQTGNTFVSGVRPGHVSAGEVARLYLAGLGAGADSVTGWCFNVRSRDWEAGEWALLDDMDEHSPRSRMLSRLHETVRAMREHAGELRAAEPRAWVVSDPHAQAQEWLNAVAYDGNAGSEIPGRGQQDGANGAGALSAALMRTGIPSAVVPFDALPTDPAAGDVAVVSHQVAWPDGVGDRLLQFADSGGTVLLDGTSGRKDDDATLNRPWPGGIADHAGLRATGLETRVEGYDIELNDERAGTWMLARSKLDVDDAWTAREELRFADGQPCAWVRPWGDGRLVLARGIIGPSLVHEPGSAATDYLLRYSANGIDVDLRPATPRTIALPVEVDRGRLTIVLAPDANRRDGPVRLTADSRTYHDLWTDDVVTLGEDGSVELSAEAGIGLLWQRE